MSRRELGTALLFELLLLTLLALLLGAGDRPRGRRPSHGPATIASDQNRHQGGTTR